MFRADEKSGSKILSRTAMEGGEVATPLCGQRVRGFVAGGGKEEDYVAQ
jgi:hypothetical protein